MAYWGLSIIYPQFWDLLGSPRTVNTTLAPSTFLIGITSETHQHQALQHHQLWLIILKQIYRILNTIEARDYQVVMRVKFPEVKPLHFFPNEWEWLLISVESSRESIWWISSKHYNRILGMSSYILNTFDKNAKFDHSISCNISIFQATRKSFCLWFWFCFLQHLLSLDISVCCTKKLFILE